MFIAITLFRLAPGKTIQEYEAFSRESVAPLMIQMPSVISFEDARSLRRMDGTAAQWDAVEVIRISSPEEFEADHEISPGKDVAAAWAEWVDVFEVTYFSAINEATHA